MSIETESLSVFVGGVPLSVDEQMLYNYFINFGALQDCVIQKHKKTKLSRGYGFVIFERKEDAYNCVKYQNHFIIGRKISCSIAKNKGEAINEIFQKQFNKLFIGGISSTINEEQLFIAFSKFGLIEKVYLIYDKVTGISKGFGFLEYQDENIARKVAASHFIWINDCRIEIKPK